MNHVVIDNIIECLLDRPCKNDKTIMDFVPVTSSTSLNSSELPIQKFRNEILYLIENNSVVIVVGETGSGKTTQIPRFLLEQGWSGIACTQPRRLSAIAMANRVSQELGFGGDMRGGAVGYSVRFDDMTSEKTRCRFITDGMLFRECLHDPLLSKYSVIMIDEAHERSLHTDLLLAVIKKILPKRPELRIIISSATIDAEAFKKYFTLPRTDLITGKRIYGPSKPEENTTNTTNNDITDPSLIKDFIPIDRFEPKIISIEGRNFPVEVEFLLSGPSDRMIQSEEIIIDAVVRLIQGINENSKVSGDILVFLSGRSEIEKSFELLSVINHKRQGDFEGGDATELMGLFNKKNKKTKFESSQQPRTLKLELLQLYAGMKSSDQLKVFEPARTGYRKVILSTNISEASVTIDGIAYVIDSGRVKLKVFDCDFGEKLVTVPVSRASADQRAGRAGRTRPGKAFRLYTREFFEMMPKHSIPDLQLTNLTSIILQLKAMHINNVEDFDFLSPLPSRNIQFALNQLERLGALNPLNGALIDPFGKRMAQLPLEPELAHFFLKASIEFNCPREAAALSAMLTIQNSNQNGVNDQFFLNSSSDNSNFLKNQRKFWVEEGDHLTLLSIFMSFLANAGNSVKFCQKFGLNLKTLNLANRLYTNLLAYLSKIFKIPTERSFKMSIEEISINLRKCLISAYPLNISKSDEHNSCYRSLSEPSQNQTNSMQFIHPNSVLFKRLPPLILYGNQVETTKKFLKFVTVIEANWLEEIHPNLYKQRRK